MPALPVVENYTAYPWDGSNGQDIVDWLNELYPTAEYTLTSEDETEVVMTPSGGGFDVQTLDLGGAVVVRGDQMQGPHPSFAYVNLFRPEPSHLVAVGVANVPSLLLGASTMVAVTIAPAQPDGDYTPVARLVGASGQLTITSVSVVDEDTVNVTVQAALAYAGGAQVLVTCSRG